MPDILFANIASSFNCELRYSRLSYNLMNIVQLLPVMHILSMGFTSILNNNFSSFKRELMRFQRKLTLTKFFIFLLQMSPL